MPQRSTGAEHLTVVPLFSALSQRELRQVTRIADEIEVVAGTELTTQGRVGREFFLILDGRATVRRSGRKVATLGYGQYFGELALLDREPRSATVTAETDMTLLVLGQREFAGLVDSLPGMAAKLLAGIAARVRTADAKAVSL